MFFCAFDGNAIAGIRVAHDARREGSDDAVEGEPSRARRDQGRHRRPAPRIFTDLGIEVVHQHAWRFDFPRLGRTLWPGGALIRPASSSWRLVFPEDVIAVPNPSLRGLFITRADRQMRKGIIPEPRNAASDLIIAEQEAKTACHFPFSDLLDRSVEAGNLSGSRDFYGS